MRYTPPQNKEKTKANQAKEIAALTKYIDHLLAVDMRNARSFAYLEAQFEDLKAENEELRKQIS